MRQIAASIKQFGFVNPILIDEANIVIAGHGRVMAASDLGMNEVPCIVIAGLSDAKKRALMLADNKIAANAGWDREKLAIELPELTGLLQFEDIDIDITGFEIPEIDQLAVDFSEKLDPADEFEENEGKAISAVGDVWLLGDHRIMCGNARNAADVDHLMDGQTASMAFLDPLTT